MEFPLAPAACFWAKPASTAPQAPSGLDLYVCTVCVMESGPLMLATTAILHSLNPFIDLPSPVDFCWADDSLGWACEQLAAAHSLTELQQTTSCSGDRASHLRGWLGAEPNFCVRKNPPESQRYLMNFR